MHGEGLLLNAAQLMVRLRRRHRGGSVHSLSTWWLLPSAMTMRVIGVDNDEE